VTPDIVSYNAVLWGLCNAGKFQEAMRLVNAAQCAGLTPTVVTYAILMGSALARDLPEFALQAWEAMKGVTVVPDIECVNMCLDALLRLVRSCCSAGHECCPIAVLQVDMSS
jgi:pentatricopeptide repeat protein